MWLLIPSGPHACEYKERHTYDGNPGNKHVSLRVINIEEVRSLVMHAAGQAWSEDSRERVRAVSAAKALTNRAGRLVAQEAIQLHGGMGMTQELPLADFVRRLLSIELMFGGERFQRRRFVNADEQAVDSSVFVSPKKRWKQI